MDFGGVLKEDGVAADLCQVGLCLGVCAGCDYYFYVFWEGARQPEGDVRFSAGVGVQEVLDTFDNNYNFV